VSWWLVALLAGLGGSLRALLIFYNQIGAWQRARRDRHTAGRRGDRPPFAHCVDWEAELIGMASQVLLGAVAGGILSWTGTVTGVAGAILAGAGAPAILAQLNQVQSIHDAVVGPQKPKHQEGPSDTIDDTVAGRKALTATRSAPDRARPSQSDTEGVDQEEAPGA
jgi:hypothetical protein